jgi:hypothetical protein
MSARTCRGPTEGSWSTSPTTSRAARFGTALSSACMHQQHVDHRLLIDDEQVTVDGITFAEHLHAGHLTHPARSTSGRGAQQDSHALGTEEFCRPRG